MDVSPGCVRWQWLGKKYWVMEIQNTIHGNTKYHSWKYKISFMEIQNTIQFCFLFLIPMADFLWKFKLFWHFWENKKCYLVISCPGHVFTLNLNMIHSFGHINAHTMNMTKTMTVAISKTLPLQKKTVTF